MLCCWRTIEITFVHPPSQGLLQPKPRALKRPRVSRPPQRINTAALVAPNHGSGTTFATTNVTIYCADLMPSIAAWMCCGHRYKVSTSVHKILPASHNFTCPLYGRSWFRTLGRLKSMRLSTPSVLTTAVRQRKLRQPTSHG